MQIVTLRDRDKIEAFLRQNTNLYLYHLGDLDDFFWSYTKWHGLIEAGKITAIALIYTGIKPATLLALSHNSDDRMAVLIDHLVDNLPKQVYVHLSPGIDKIMARKLTLTSHGEHYRMALYTRALLNDINTTGVVHLGEQDCNDLLKLYTAAYPGNWFDKRMLATAQYFGVREGGTLIAAGGVHVYSPKYKVAALGNITTLPEYRDRGLATKITARLCTSLLATTDDIGLNVKTDNHSAIACYRKLGFEVLATYEEFMAYRR